MFRTIELLGLIQQALPQQLSSNFNDISSHLFCIYVQYNN